MRKILFRGKRRRTGEWIESMTISYGTIKSKMYDIFMEVAPDKWQGVLPETVGQFTGLTDKNRKEIFEGDIVRCQEFKNKGMPSLEFEERELFAIDELKGEKETEYISEVIYDEANFYVNQNGSCEVPLCLFFGNMKHSSRIYEIEVIGNRYDNPELLK